MKSEWYAHSLKNQPIETWQPLTAHLLAVAALAREFAAPFASEKWAEVAGVLHDLGKADSAFQGYLLRQNGLDDTDYDSGRINHSSAGAAFAEGKYPKLKLGRILAYLVAGHHAGLPDYDTAETGAAALQSRLQEGRDNLARIRAEANELTATLPTVLVLPPFVKQKGCHLWIRLLYSCLVDADFLDTEAFMNPQQTASRGGLLTIGELKALFDAHMVEKAAAAPATPVNRIRGQVLAACRDAARQDASLFTMTVPTGGGKTLSAMAFALDYAARLGKKRIIYAIPYTSIIEQTAAVLSGIFGAKNVIEHHSNLDPDRETQRSRLAAENWDAPLVVTTNVQFFESLFAAKSSRCRKLHNLVNSVVILDEAQMIEPSLLVPCVSALNELTRHYGVTVVLSTATQPALPGLDPACEIIPPELDLYGRLRRVEYAIPADLRTPLTWPELAEKLRAHEQVLCIVNKRRDCYDLFQMMPPGTIHLSALMCGEHRSRVIAEIKRRLATGEACRVISTQLVEAGVDIDFPVVYRALAGIASLAQAAGRCNREGKLGILGRVIVFVPPQPPPPGILRKGETTTRELLQSDTAPFFNANDPEIFRRYFDLFYAKLNNTGTEFTDWLEKDAASLSFAFRTAAANFHLIDDQSQRPVIVRYGQEMDSLIKSLRFSGPTRAIMRQFQRYTVSVHTRTLAIMQRDGLVEEICDGVFVQTLSGLYTETVGLDIFRDSPPAEDLIL
jgi:CRISPR-associated endonuclease/helicase Cas3